MSSILTNTGAMVALQSLKSINKGLGETQSMISTGKKVANAKDNAAIYAISKVMESDVSAFKAVSETLSMAESTVGTAANGAKKIGELLVEIKGKITSASGDGIDTQKVQDDITAMVGQITNIVDSAQFNGVNLLDGSKDTDGFSALASLNRSADGSVNNDSISLATADSNLSTSSGTALTVGDAAAGVTGTEVFNVGNQDNSGASGIVDGAVTLTAADGTATTDGITIGGFDFQDAAGATGGLSARAADAAGVDTASVAALVAGDVMTIDIGNTQARYTIREGDTNGDVSSGLRTALLDAGLDTDKTSVGVDANGFLQISNLTTDDVEVNISSARASGGLAGLDNLNVVSDLSGAQADIETFIQNVADAEATLGTTAKRLSIQNEFVSTQIDSFKQGIGALVDADMEETSARLQALQTQQQLGVQALSIANQAPQSILSLFR
ncbi:flagellin [Palleronia abyssalis]|uniref:Flagellin n=1 Tax=Palleronia abyssalis TaxID=1501240 RepID=A0A2R8BWU1_9RHOB|nr:flagellin [Palleronia abyssalis]SPJ24631.1 Flagellin [Palleronia abyssalis]